MSKKKESQPNSEDALWSGLSFPVLEIPELAAEQADVEDVVHENQGVWWRRAAHGFYQPSFAWQVVAREKCWPKRLPAAAGYTHLAPEESANGYYRVIVRQNVSEYSIAQLARGRRYSVRHGLSNLQIRPIERLSDLQEQGADVYASWRQRTGWGRDKIASAQYRDWIAKVFSRPKRLAIGAYSGDRLVAFILPFAVQHVVALSFIASHSDYLKLRPNEALFHALMTIARQTAGVELVDFGTLSAKQTLNQFKLEFATVAEFPSYTWINPVLRPFVSSWLRQRYPWLHNPKLIAEEGGGLLRESEA